MKALKIQKVFWKEQGVFVCRLESGAPLIVIWCYQHVIAYPISQDQLVNIVAFVSDMTKEGTIYEGATVVDADQEEFLSQYNGWEREVITIIEVWNFTSLKYALIVNQCIEKPSRWATQTLNPLKIYASGRVALMGDAVSFSHPNTQCDSE